MRSRPKCGKKALAADLATGAIGLRTKPVATQDARVGGPDSNGTALLVEGQLHGVDLFSQHSATAPAVKMSRPPRRTVMRVRTALTEMAPSKNTESTVVMWWLGSWWSWRVAPLSDGVGYVASWDVGSVIQDRRPNLSILASSCAYQTRAGFGISNSQGTSRIAKPRAVTNSSRVPTWKAPSRVLALATSSTS